MVKIILNGGPVEVPDGTTVLAAAERAGIDIPHFCYHPALEPEGSCRMCLVEIEGSPKLELACSTTVREGMRIETSSPPVLKARRQVLELLLAEHPLDCPICDKAGECRLQIYADLLGPRESRFAETKERRDKKIRIGKSLILDRERCILCTRCVRFLRKVTGTGELGVFERGLRSEIGIYEAKTVDNNYSGNLVDICPVGAITDADFRFKTRKWFLESKNSVCPHCGRGCQIAVDLVRGYPLGDAESRIYRIRAAENPEVNGFWICDRGRYSHREIADGRRLKIRASREKDEEEKAAGWDVAVRTAAKKIQSLFKAGRGSHLAVLLSGFLTNEEFEMSRRLFVDALEVRKVFFADPKDGEPDGLLLTAERVPNRRGAEDLGFRPGLPNLDTLSSSTDVLFIFGHGLLEQFEPGKLRTSLAGIKTKILLDSHRSDLDGMVDIILPVAVTAEKTGSFTNISGITQHFEAALDPPGECLPEGEVLNRLAAALGVKKD
jgi:NADH-quinone oxidoreductase subunit G